MGLYGVIQGYIGFWIQGLIIGKCIFVCEMNERKLDHRKGSSVQKLHLNELANRLFISVFSKLYLLSSLGIKLLSCSSCMGCNYIPRSVFHNITPEAALNPKAYTLIYRTP